MEALVGALSWNPEIKGGLYVLVAVLILPGSAYLLLATNTGARLGFQLALAGLAGYMVIMGGVWWVYGIGPIGPSPGWEPVETVVGEPSESRIELLREFPEGWRVLDVADPEVADAGPVVEEALTADEGGLFQSAAEYMVVGAAAKGGERYSPFGLPSVRPINIFHRPHYLVVQVQQVVEQEVDPGAPPPTPRADPSQPVVSVVMIRDLGAVRLHPAVATISSALVFGLVVYQLHVRDKEALARRG